MRHSVWLDLSLPYIKYYLEVVNVMVIFVWLVPYVYAVPYRLPYGFTVPYLQYIRYRRDVSRYAPGYSTVSPSRGLGLTVVAPSPVRTPVPIHAPKSTLLPALARASTARHP